MKKDGILITLAASLSLAGLLTLASARAHPSTRNPTRYVIPHFAETQGSVINAPHAFDTVLFATYTSGLADIPEGDELPAINLYLYDDRTDRPLRSAKGADVCNPCIFALGGKAGHKQTIRFENLITDAGGFPASTVTGYAVLTVERNPEAVKLSGDLINSHSGPFDLSFSQIEIQRLLP